MNEARRDSLQFVNIERGAHAGLILSRYLSQAAGGAPEHRVGLLKAAMNAVTAAAAVYDSARERWKTTLPESARVYRFETRPNSSLILGLGGSSVLETGLTLHHAYGVPFLPGSAVKGLAAHYAHQIWGAVNPGWKIGGGCHQLMFGAADAGGLVEFSDGWIERPQGCLIPDVMTPHHGDYYMAPENAIPEPTDFDSPSPVPFLAVKGAFLIAISKADIRLPDTWLDHAEQLLKQSLGNWGIGAKTNADYGCLEFAPLEQAAKPTERASEPDTVMLELKSPASPGVWNATIVGTKRTGTVTGVPAKKSQRNAQVRARIVSESPLMFQYAPQ